MEAKLENGYWVIETNKWNAKKYSKENAENHSKTMVMCKNCIDSFFCFECTNCTNCFNCILCHECDNCSMCRVCGHLEDCHGSYEKGYIDKLDKVNAVKK